jgi:DNA-binding LytR/AlgR family response regulator
MHIVICDDEKVFLDHLKELLVRDSVEKNMDITVTQFFDGRELLEAYGTGKLPHMDVLFLDIRMERTDGLETARILREKGCGCLIIFLTSLEAYAREGYEVKAFRYLLKDQTDKDLGKVMDACRRELGTEEYFTFSYERRSYRIRKRDILYFESRKRVIILFTSKEEYQFYQKLDVLEEQLSGNGFFRCHRSFLVQERYVKSWKEHALWLEDGREIPISRTYEKDVNRRLMLRMGD